MKKSCGSSTIVLHLTCGFGEFLKFLSASGHTNACKDQALSTSATKTISAYVKIMRQENLIETTWFIAMGYASIICYTGISCIAVEYNIFMAFL